MYSSAQDTTLVPGNDTTIVLKTRIVLSYPYLLGSDTVFFHRTTVEGGSTDVILLNVHDDENTGTEAALALIDSIGGELLELKHTGTRNLHFSIEDSEIRVDPNRIYTPNGIRASLKAFAGLTTASFNLVHEFADSLINGYLIGKKLVVALHNNTEGGLSIRSYLKGGTEVKNAAKVYINPAMDIDDFVLTTRSDVFTHLTQLKINAVLQHKNPVDDGSLSVYAARYKVGYINVEAQHGHFEQQSAMLFALYPFMKNL